MNKWAAYDLRFGRGALRDLPELLIPIRQACPSILKAHRPTSCRTEILRLRDPMPLSPPSSRWSLAFSELAEDRFPKVHHFFQSEPGDHFRSTLGQARSLGSIAHQVIEDPSQCVHILRRHQDAIHAVADDLSRAGRAIEAHHW